MSIGIGRKLSVGIADETAWGTAAVSPDYFLPVTDLSIEEQVSQAENVAMLGSTYGVNDTKINYKFANFTMTFKADENSLPLLLKQFCTVSSTAASGETTVYQHTCTFNATNSGTSFTLFIDDPDRADNQQYIAGARYDTLNITAENGGFVMVEVSGRGKYPVTTLSGVTVESPREFVGRNTTFKYATYSGTLTTTGILSLTLNHTFGLTDDADNINLGDDGLSQLYNTVSRFEGNVSMHYPDNTIRDDWASGIRKKYEVIIKDTDRYVATSTGNTNPSITIDYPEAKILNWAREGGADDILKQSFTLLALDKVGIADAPIKVVVVNNIASY